MTTTPDFQALRASLANKTFDNYTMPEKHRIQPARESESGCPSGKEAYPSIADIMKAKNTCGSPVRYKSFYRCSVCGQYHFSRKEEEPARSARYDRKKGNGNLKLMFSISPADWKEMEYVSLF